MTKCEFLVDITSYQITCFQLTSSSLSGRFKFPLTLIIYQTLAVLIFVIFDFAHYLSLKATVCSSRDLVKSVQPENATGYCQFVGR